MRVAVLQTYGAGGRMGLAHKFRQWEDEALTLVRNVDAEPAAWQAVVEQRRLVQKSPYAQGLLSVCHRDVVLEAQHQAIRTALSPAQCAMPRTAGEASITRRHVDELRAQQLIVIDNALPRAVVDACRQEPTGPCVTLSRLSRLPRTVTSVTPVTPVTPVSPCHAM